MRPAASQPRNARGRKDRPQPLNPKFGLRQSRMTVRQKSDNELVWEAIEPSRCRAWRFMRNSIASVPASCRMRREIADARRGRTSEPPATSRGRSPPWRHSTRKDGEMYCTGPERRWPLRYSRRPSQLALSRIACRGARQAFQGPDRQCGDRPNCGRVFVGPRAQGNESRLTAERLKDFQQILWVPRGAFAATPLAPARPHGNEVGRVIKKGEVKTIWLKICENAVTGEDSGECNKDNGD
jgi:hypothetical protein